MLFVDSLIRSLEAQWASSPCLETASLLISAYQRSRSKGLPAPLTKDSIDQALAKSDLGSGRIENSGPGKWLITFKYTEPELSSVMLFANHLHLNADQIRLSGGCEDETTCNCGACSRDCGERFYMEITEILPKVS